MPKPCRSTSTVIPATKKTSLAAACAGVVLVASFAHVSSATTITDIGVTGSAGLTRPIPTRGGAGGNALAGAVSSDYENTIQAAAGRGGEGGSSTVLLPGATGGAGGKAEARLTARDQVFTEDQIELDFLNNVTAVGGAGGNGGSGLVPGNGGTGGHAIAAGTQMGTNTSSLNYPAIYDLLHVDATGGDGGVGLNGGAGGAAKAAAAHTPAHTVGGADGVAQAQGGNGGTGVLLGGRGGTADASVVAKVGAFPSFSVEHATAVGGQGGTSSIGLHGNGGDAKAAADGTFAARDLGMDVTAKATGGDSGGGSGFALSGKGGNAFATATGHSTNVASAYPNAVAQGGTGAVRGGDAVAYANGVSDFMSGSATATATGGAGPRAGVALATAVSENSWIANGAIATANYSGGLVRNVIASGGTLAVDNGPLLSKISAQAAIGDTQKYAVPPPMDTTFIVSGVGAPAATVANAALAGNTQIANTLQDGTVLALGEFGTNSGVYDDIHGTISYQFDAHDAGADHLWLGLLDADLPANSFGNFHFSVMGEGLTLFAQDFTGASFLDFFNDRVFDLGAWSTLAGSDGLFNIDVAFSGYVSDINFLFGAADTSGGHANVPEPPALLLLGSGLLGLLSFRSRRREH